MITIPRNPTDRDLRVFAALGSILLLVFSLWLHLVTNAIGLSAWLRIAAIALVLLGLLRPAWLRTIYVGWMMAVFPIGWLIANTLLAIVYFGVLTPIGWALRRFGHDPLQFHADREASSYWHSRVSDREPSRYFRQF